MTTVKKILQKKLQEYFCSHDTISLFKSDGSNPRTFTKKYAIAFYGNYQGYRFTDYDKFIEFAKKNKFTWKPTVPASLITIPDAVNQITRETLEKKLKKRDKVYIYSATNLQCTIRLDPYIECGDMEFGIDCSDLADYCYACDRVYLKNNKSFMEE